MYLLDIKMGAAAQGVKMAASIIVQSDLSPKKVLLSHKPHNKQPCNLSDTTQSHSGAFFCVQIENMRTHTHTQTHR